MRCSSRGNFFLDKGEACGFTLNEQRMFSESQEAAQPTSLPRELEVPVLAQLLRSALGGPRSRVLPPHSALNKAGRREVKD